MNRRRKVGSTLVLSSLAALAIVGMGLAAATLPATTTAEFGFEWTPAPEEPDTAIGTVEASTDMSTVKLVVDEAAKTAKMKAPVQFAFTPDASLVDHTFALSYSFTLPEGFDTYFELTAGKEEQTVAADAVSTMATEGDLTFTIPETALAASLIGDFAEAQTAFETANIIINVTVKDVTGTEPDIPEEIVPTTEPLVLTAELLGVTSYNSNPTTTNVNEYSFEFTNLTKGTGADNGAIQSNKKTPASNIRNLTALPEIQSIVVNSDSTSKALFENSALVAFSTSAIEELSGENFKPMELSSDGKSMTIEAPQGTTFFRIVRNGDGAQYYDSIVINFAA